MVLLRVPGRQDGALRDDPQVLLALEAALPHDVPPVGVFAPVLLGIRRLDLQRCMDGAMGEVQEPWLRGMAGPDLADHVERPVGEVVREVVVVGVPVDLDDVVVLVEPVRMVEVGETVEDPVEAVEPLLAGPPVAGTGLGEVGVLAEVPLADHERGPTGVAQHIGHRYGVVAWVRLTNRSPER